MYRYTYTFGHMLIHIHTHMCRVTHMHTKLHVYTYLNTYSGVYTHMCMPSRQKRTFYLTYTCSQWLFALVK